MPSPPAQYLLRFDDFCPTMLTAPRERFLSLLSRYNVSPILAVVPDNHDPDLGLQAPDTRFWERLRTYQEAGATIAMHGYRHLCNSRGKSILRLHRETEFAGVGESQQREWIRRGLEILRGHGLNPRLFVAPRHGFDRATIRALVHEGLNVLSDGFSRRAFALHDVLWIPQQLWEPVPRSTGLWTICIHTNSATEKLERNLQHFLEVHGRQCITFGEVIANASSLHLNWSERLAESIAHQRVRIARARKRLIASE